MLLGARNAAEVTDATAMISHPVPDEMWLALRAQGLLPPGAPVPVPTLI